MHGKNLLAFVFLVVLISACIGTAEKPKIDKEKALLLARVRFLEANPGRTGVEELREEGKTYVISYNITDAKKGEIDFAEYYADKYTGQVFASARYSLALAVKASPELKAIFERYPSATTSAELIESPDKKEPSYVWEMGIIANGVNVASIRFDAVNEKIVSFYKKAELGFSFTT